MTTMPNKSPTPVGAGSSASRFTVLGPAWLNFNFGLSGVIRNL